MHRRLIVTNVQRREHPTHVLARASFEQSRVAHGNRAHHDRIRAQPKQLVEVLFGSNPAGHLHLEVPKPDDRLDRLVVVAEPSGAVEIDDVDAICSSLGEADGNVSWIVRVDGRIRVVAAYEANAPAAQDIDGGDDEHSLMLTPSRRVEPWSF
jgi:hypothetical protein